MSKPRAITEFISNQFPAFEDTLLRSGRLHKLWQKLQHQLNTDLATHCQLLNLRDGMLIMACDSTAWATRLRFQTPSLLEAMRLLPGDEEIQEIQIKIQPVAQSAQSSKSRATLSSHGADCLKQCAKSVNDPALQQALERLATREHKS